MSSSCKVGTPSGSSDGWNGSASRIGPTSTSTTGATGREHLGSDDCGEGLRALPGREAAGRVLSLQAGPERHLVLVQGVPFGPRQGAASQAAGPQAASPGRGSPARHQEMQPVQGVEAAGGVRQTSTVQGRSPEVVP